jgi:hypothetical protein
VVCARKVKNNRRGKKLRNRYDVVLICKKSRGQERVRSKMQWYCSAARRPLSVFQLL